jgi:hypothetical protein
MNCLLGYNSRRQYFRWNRDLELCLIEWKWVKHKTITAERSNPDVHQVIPASPRDTDE